MVILLLCTVIGAKREREREREIIYDLCSDVNVNIFGSLKRFKETLFYF